MPELLTLLLSGATVPYVAVDAVVRQGLPARALSELVREGWLSWDEADRAVAPRRTLSRRLKDGGALSAPESDRVAALAGLFGQAARVFGDREKARTWLRQPSDRFEGRTPLEMATTHAGGAAVTEALRQIDHGVLA